MKSVTENSARLLTAFFGVCGSGRVIVPIDFRLSPGEVADIVKHSGSRVLYVDPELTDSLADVPVEHTFVIGDDDDAYLFDTEPRPWVPNENATATINDTSGRRLGPGVGRSPTAASGPPPSVLARSNVVLEGYWAQPEETAIALRDSWFHTGDGGTIGNDGYLTIHDRKKDVIITGGENVSSIEVEDAIFSYPGVAEVDVPCALLGGARPAGELTGVAGLRTRAYLRGHETTPEDPVRRACRSRPRRDGPDNAGVCRADVGQ